MSYSVEPHVCAARWARVRGGAQLVEPVPRDYLTLGQVLHGGTPYARLADGSLLGAMHVKDGAHAPALYHTIFTSSTERRPSASAALAEALLLAPPRRAAARRRALQYAVGLAVDEAADVALVSPGDGPAYEGRRAAARAPRPRAGRICSTTPRWPSRLRGVGLLVVHVLGLTI